jgi:hypothetical protein
METEAETTLLLEGAALAQQRKEFWRQCLDMISKQTVNYLPYGV